MPSHKYGSGGICKHTDNIYIYIYIYAFQTILAEIYRIISKKSLFQ